MQPTAIAVLGMHRSGTSALARSIADLGAFVGSEQYITRRGEHQLLQDCNQALLLALGGHWSAPPELSGAWHASAQASALRDAAMRALDDFEGRSVYAWKDPRNSFTLPFWESLLEARAVVALIVRDPLEVAASLAKRNDFSPGHALALWEAYNRAAIASAQGHSVCVVRYSDLVDRPVETIESFVDAMSGFGVTFPRTANAGAQRVDPSARHHRSDATEAAALLTQPQRDLWQALEALPAVHQRFSMEVGSPHPASLELLATRRALLASQRERDGLAQQLRSRRDALRRLFTK